MKTVKRKAEVGERIYDSGTGRTEIVKAVFDTHVRASGRLNSFDAVTLIPHDGYEVIIEDEPLERLKPNRIGKDGSVAMPDRVHPKLTTERRDDLDYGGPMGAPIPPHSAHYHQTGIDPLEVMRQTFPPEKYEGFLHGNALKYIMRYPLKGTPVDDLEKAGEYVKRLLEYQRNPEGRAKVTLRNGQGEVIAEGYEEGAE